MRMIKFRALCAITGVWRYGFYYVSKGNHIIRNDQDKESIVLPSTVGQFTGILDKNGKEVYEGDLLIDREFDELGNDISGHYPVIYSEKTAQFCVDNSFKKDGGHIVWIVTYFGIEDLEVIGNIHDRREVK